jgi:hypothetical protein
MAVPVGCGLLAQRQRGKYTAQKAEEIPGVKYTTWNTRCIFIDSIQMSSIYSKNTPGIHNGVFPVVYFFSFLRSVAGPPAAAAPFSLFYFPGCLFGRWTGPIPSPIRPGAARWHHPPPCFCQRHAGPGGKAAQPSPQRALKQHRPPHRPSGRCSPRCSPHRPPH